MTKVLKLALWTLPLTVFTSCLMCFPNLGFGSELNDSQKKIEQIIQEYILNNPEVLLESIKRLNMRNETKIRSQHQQALKELRGALEFDPNTHISGNPDGDVSVIAFFDYRCTYCKKFVSVVNNLIKSDPSVRVIYKELPILGPGSLTAAQAALASRLQNVDFYLPFHEALMETRNVSTKQQVLDIAAAMGINIDKLNRDMESPEIERAIELNQIHARALGIQGTPGLIIGDQIIRGFINGEELNSRIVEARRSCLTC